MTKLGRGFISQKAGDYIMCVCVCVCVCVSSWVVSGCITLEPVVTCLLRHGKCSGNKSEQLCCRASEGRTPEKTSGKTEHYSSGKHAEISRCRSLSLGIILRLKMEYHASDNCTAGSKDLYTFYFSVMIVEFILALPLNLSVIYLFIFKLKFWRSKSNNIFLFNLVLADILLLFCLPVRAYYFQRGERRSNNDAVCKTVLFMLFLNRGASIAFLTIISIDRLVSVVHPGIKNPFKIRKRSVLISVLVWVLLLPLTIPSMLSTFECCNSDPDSESPDDIAADVFRELVFFTTVLVPSIVLVYCTVRITNRLKQKTVGDRTKLRRAVFLVILVVLVFSFCFWPSAISRLVLLVVRYKELQHAEEIAVQVYDGLMCLSYLDCLLDPIVYCLSSSKFKHVYIATYLPFLVKAQHGEHH